MDPAEVRRAAWGILDASAGLARVLDTAPVQEQQGVRQAALGLNFLPPTDDAARAGWQRLGHVYDQATRLIDHEREILRKAVEAGEQAIAPHLEELAEMSARAGFLDGYNVAGHCGESAPEAVLLAGKAILQMSAAYNSSNSGYPFNLDWALALARVVEGIKQHKAAVRTVLQQPGGRQALQRLGERQDDHMLADERENPCLTVDGRMSETHRRILCALDEHEGRKWARVAETADLDYDTVRKESRHLQQAGWVEKRKNVFFRTSRATEALKRYS